MSPTEISGRTDAPATLVVSMADWEVKKPGLPAMAGEKVSTSTKLMKSTVLIIL
jgi:hypothetical protein